MMKHVLSGLAAALVLSGCSCWNCDTPRIGKGNYHDPITICKTSDPVKIDGKLDDAIWQTAPKHQMVYVDESVRYPDEEARQMLNDTINLGYVQAAYDDKNLYVAISLEDQDVLSYVNKDQDFLFRNADTVELFIWPTEGFHYWEFYSTPTNHKTGFYYRSGGLLTMPRTFDVPIVKGFNVASQVQGTLNKEDIDTGWTTEMIIPLSELNRHGIAFEPSASWKMQVSRYNHSWNIYRTQFTTYPKQYALGGFHNRTCYAPVIFK